MMKEDWVECTLGDIASKITKGSTPTTYGYKYQREGINFIKIENVVNGKIDLKSIHQFISEEAHNSQQRSQLKEGDVLFSIAGTIGETCLIKEEVLPANTNQAFAIINGFNSVLEADFLRKQFDSFVSRKVKSLARGGAMNNVSLTNLKEMIISLPPLPIQRAIVSKIESLFSSLDSGIADLKKAQAQLKIYRQAVLKKAFEGELTKEWRAKQKDLPSAEALLEEIKIERERYYEEQVKDWKKAVGVWEDNGKEGKKPSKPRAMREVDKFTLDEIIDFAELPNGWKWVKFGNIFQVFVGSTPSRKKNEYWENGTINWVSSGEVAFNTIIDTKEKITKEGLDNASTTVHPKGTVMLAMIGEGKTRGQAAILEINACHNQNTAAIRVSEIGFPSKYLYHYLFFKYEGNRRLGSGNNQKALNQGRILEFDYPLCSKEEQNQIVKEIESRLSVCDKVEESITTSLVKAEALRQSILKKAFEGKLLSAEEIAACRKEKDYEAASVLLERIKTEKK